MTARVDGIGDQFLAGARLAGHHHRSHAARHLDDALLDRAHARRVANQPQQGRFAKRRWRRAKGPAHLRNRTGAAAAWWRWIADNRGNDRAKLFEVDRLGQVIERAGLERLDRVFCRAIGRDDNTTLPALLRADVADQLQAETIGQPHVGDDQVKSVFMQAGKGLRQAFSGIDPEALAQQRQLIERAQVRFVIDNQYAGRIQRCS